MLEGHFPLINNNGHIDYLFSNHCCVTPAMLQQVKEVFYDNMYPVGATFDKVEDHSNLSI